MGLLKVTGFIVNHKNYSELCTYIHLSLVYWGGGAVSKGSHKKSTSLNGLGIYKRAMPPMRPSPIRDGKHGLPSPNVPVSSCSRLTVRDGKHGFHGDHHAGLDHSVHVLSDKHSHH